MHASTVAIDLAKEVFELAFADAQGRIIERKRLSRRAFIRSLETRPPLRVLMEACGGAHGWARRFQRQGHTVRLLPARDVRPYVTAAHVLVLPSWREGTPTSIMEGMSMGRPAVVTDAPGCREVVRPGLNGYLVPLRDPQALASAMEAFIISPQDIARMGQAGRELALSEFDAEKVAARILHDMHVPTTEDTL